MDSSSEDEVFFGKLRLREVKKRLGVLQKQPRIEDSEDVKILARSEPNLFHRNLPRTPKILTAKSVNQICESPRRNRDSCVPITWENNVSDESFLLMEHLTNIATPETAKNVLSLSDESMPSFHDASNPSKSLGGKDDSFVGVPDDLDNTIDRIDFILKQVEDKKKIKTETHDVNKALKSKLPLLHSSKKPPVFKTPLKPKEKTSNLKTPIKQSGLQTYDSIVSPIAYYIKHSATAPLIQNVRPSKPIVSSALTQKCPEVMSRGKENGIPQLLPRKAYKSAKETKLIENVISTGLPKNKQVTDMVEEISKAKIIKHEARVKTEGVQPKRGLNIDVSVNVEDSFANLSLAHADVSVCTVKTAAHTETLASRKF